MFQLYVKHFDGEIELEGTYNTYKDASETGKFMFAQIRGVRGYEVKEVKE